MLKRLATLPREARDTLFLLGVVAWVIGPHAAHLPLWCMGLAAAALAWRAFICLGSHALPRKSLLLVLLALTLAATWATHRTLLGRDAGVTLIVLLLALKTLEMRARRDTWVVFFLGFFTLLTHFFFSQSLLTALTMLLGLLGLMTALVNSHMPAGRPPLSQAARIAGTMALLGAPIMAVLFVLFPRLAPLWGTPQDAMSGRSGLSAQMQVGDIARLALNDAVALRVRFEDAQPQAAELYFRGPVLSTFDGRQWLPLRSNFQPQLQAGANLQVAGEPLRYEVTLEPSYRPWVMVLDGTAQPPQIPGFSAHMTAELQWLANAPFNELVRYRVSSHPQHQHGPLRKAVSLQDYLDLPPGFNPRTLQYAAELRRNPALEGPEALIRHVLEQLRTGGYTYTLEPGAYRQHTADEFWFDRKLGFCEHIASAFVILMRALDIPARVVTGYQGGERNTVDNFWVIRQSDAHAWAEVWLSGRGWVRVDPTAAVSPGRVSSLQRLQAPANVLTTAIRTVSPGLLVNLRAVWEALNNRWNQWVLNYTQSRQLNLLRAWGFASPSWEDLGLLLAACLVVAGLGGAVWTLWERHQHDPWLRLLARASHRLNALADPPHSPARTPRELAAWVQDRWGPDHAQAQAIGRWLLALEAQRYARQEAAEARRALAKLQREFQLLDWPT